MRNDQEKDRVWKRTGQSGGRGKIGNLSFLGMDAAECILNGNVDY
jgi:hypothetical protein